MWSFSGRSPTPCPQLSPHSNSSIFMQTSAAHAHGTSTLVPPKHPPEQGGMEWLLSAIDPAPQVEHPEQRDGLAGVHILVEGCEVEPCDQMIKEQRERGSGHGAVFSKTLSASLP